MKRERPALIVLIFLALLGWIGGTCTARAERRLAFVVGIDTYPHLNTEAQLQRAVADATSIGDKLEQLGFTVTRLAAGVTVDQDQFLRRFAAWTRDIQPGDVALFYYAGHGVGINGANYLVPADIPDLADADEFLFRAHALAEADIRDRIEARSPRVAVMMLDACRNNPFSSTGRSIALSRGLERVESSKGILTIYAAGYGQTALDRLSDTADPDPHSVFTRVVLSELERPGINLLDFSENVREKVANLAQSIGHDQVPAVDNQLLGGRSVYLTAPPPAPAPKPPEPAPDDVAWRYLKNTTDPQELRRFLSDYPTSAHKGEAQSRLASLSPPVETAPVVQVAPLPEPALPPQPAADDVAWRMLQRTTDPQDLRRFLADFPTSPHRSEAESRLADLNPPAPVASPAPAAPARPAPTPPAAVSPDDVAWRYLQGTKDADVLRRFLSDFPSSGHRAEAEARIASLEAAKVAALPPPAEPAPTTERKLTAPQDDSIAWAKIATSDDPAAMRAFIDHYPGSELQNQAKDRLRLLDDSAWLRAAVGNVGAVRHYLDRFPGGLHAREAEARIAALEAPKVAPVRHQTIIVPRPEPPRHRFVPPARVVAPARPTAPVRHAAAAPAPAPERPHRRSAAPAARAAAPSPRPASNGCFQFEGQSYCQ